MDNTFKPFDAASYLREEADVSAYMEAVAEADNPALLVVALGTVARARNKTQLAKDADMTREGLYKALSPDGNPSFGTVCRIAKALGFRVTLEPVKMAKTVS